MLSRFSFATARRFIYPFAPALSRTLGVPLTAITSLIAINQATGILSAFIAPFAERRGHRMMIVTGLAMLTVGMWTAGLFPVYGVLIFTVCLLGLGRGLFDPALQAFIGEQIPFQRRGMVIGVVEFSWAASSLIGIPLTGAMITYIGWRAPFLAIGSTALIAMLILRRLMPRQSPTGLPGNPSFAIRDAWKRIGRSKAALGALGFAVLIHAANDNLFMVYGAWLEQTFHLNIATIGVSTSVIGVAELFGEILTASLADRLGLKRAITGGMILSAISYALLPVSGTSLKLALAVLFGVFITFEFSIVTAISLFTEFLPDARATMMSCYLAAASLGRICGAFLGGFVWMKSGIFAIGVMSSALSILALLLLIWGLRQRVEK